MSQKNDVAYASKLHNLAAFSDQSVCNVERNEKTKRNNKEKEKGDSWEASISVTSLRGQSHLCISLDLTC